MDIEGMDRQFIEDTKETVQAIFIMVVVACVILDILAFFNHQLARYAIYLELIFFQLNTLAPHEPDTLGDYAYLLGLNVLYLMYACHPLIDSVSLCIGFLISYLYTFPRIYEVDKLTMGLGIKHILTGFLLFTIFSVTAMIVTYIA